MASTAAPSALLVAAADPPRAGQRGVLGGSHQLHRQVAVRADGVHRSDAHDPGRLARITVDRLAQVTRHEHAGRGDQRRSNRSRARSRYPDRRLRMMPLQRISNIAVIPTTIVTSPGFQVSACPRAMIQDRMKAPRRRARAASRAFREHLPGRGGVARADRAVGGRVVAADEARVRVLVARGEPGQPERGAAARAPPPCHELFGERREKSR